jgi:hypothetical protein
MRALFQNANNTFMYIHICMNVCGYVIMMMKQIYNYFNNNNNEI